MAKILCLESDEDIGVLVKTCLSNYDVELLSRPVDGVNRLSKNNIGLMIVDPTSTAAYRLASLARTREIPVILLEEPRVRKNDYIYVGKPFDPIYLRQQVEKALTENGSAGSAGKGS